MTQNEKAVKNLKANSIEAFEDNDTVYVYCGDGVPVEISEFEIKFRAGLYDEHQNQEG